MSWTSPADGNDLVRVDAFVRLLAEDRGDHLLDFRDARRPAHQDDFVDIVQLEIGVLPLGVLNHLVHRPAAALDQMVDKFLERGPRDRHLQVFWAVGIGGDEGQVDVGLLGRAEFFLGLFAGLFKPLQGHRILAKIDPLLPLELVGHVVEQALVEIVAAQMGVAAGADHAEHAAAHVQKRDVERASAEVEDDDLFGRLLVQPVGQRSRGRLVDNPRDFESGDLPCVLGGLTLGVVEVGRDGDDRLIDLVTEVRLGSLFEFP
jgi:hypothetical protein